MLLTLLLTCLAAVQGQDKLPDQLVANLTLLNLPDGFHITPYTDTKVPDARNLALGLAMGNRTIVYVSSTDAGTITSLLDRDFDGVAEISCTLLTGLQNPNGIVWHKGSLYVAETEKLTRFDGIDFAVLNGCNSSLVRSKLLTPFPPQTTHGFRALALGPDEKLYVSIAAPFNIGECKDMFCTLQRLDLNGSGMETFARGIRNVGGIAWSDHPELPGTFFSVVERDLMGPDRPDDNIVMATEEGDFWGFPFCHWIGNGDPHDRAPGPGEPFSDDQQVAPGLNNATLPTNDTQGPWCAENVRTPVQALGAHVSPLAIAFYPSSPEGLPAQEGGPWRQQLWPEEYWGRLFVAEHGSWNRDPPIGYRLAAVEVSLDGVSTGHEVFVDGWLQDFGPSNRSVWGRPVGLLVMPDGSMLVSGDQEGAIYRITYEG